MATEERDAADATFGMTDLEDRFRAHDGADTRAAVLSRLAQLDRDIGAIVGRGLARDAFRRAEVTRHAVVAARDFLEKYR